MAQSMSKVLAISGFSEMFEFCSRLNCVPDLPVAVAIAMEHPKDLSFFFDADVDFY